jgi:hypothetical protein
MNNRILSVLILLHCKKIDVKAFRPGDVLRYMDPYTIHPLEEPFTIKRVKQKRIYNIDEE